jgi:hypothetical protein
MAHDTLIHALGYLADEDDELTVSKVRIKASNGFALHVAYSPDDDTIYSTSPITMSLREHWNDPQGNDVDREAATEWRERGRSEIRNRFEGYFADKETTVDI